ncbi:hypothetical protein JQ633_01005 [Bradyrhizobium tropiciagri]|uniref:hypothetical protein n=1 Tax=Bradyrhizobium tropiciagri TaxID=312253 RepID=UPI001BA7D911|nr:hypothetical protein [Bradyrhizobium tropiciagri]MBR0868919.1 hypothetical protein [Bradyrhizobium tropiciagri]
MNEADIRNRTLIEAMRRITALEGNEKYKQAWKRSIQVLADMLVDIPKEVPDKREQISELSSRPV